MSIEKYLDNVKIPDKHPGPLSVKIKYDIKKRLVLRRKRREQFYIAVSSLCLMLFMASALFVYRPQYALKVHDTVLTLTNSVKDNSEDIEQLEAEKRQQEMQLPDEGKLIGSQSRLTSSPNSRFRAVSTGSQASTPFQIMELSQLEEETPYVIRKVRDNNSNRYIYYLQEISSENGLRLPY